MQHLPFHHPADNWRGAGTLEFGTNRVNNRLLHLELQMCVYAIYNMVLSAVR